MTILVDARHVGKIMRHTRRSLRLTRDHVATILNISRSEYADYEHGKQLIPDTVLHKLFMHSFISIHTRHALQFGPWRKNKNKNSSRPVGRN